MYSPGITGKYQARYVIDGLLHSALTLKLPDGEEREAFLPPHHLVELKHCASFGRITYSDDYKVEPGSVDPIMKAVLAQPENFGELSVYLAEPTDNGSYSIKEEVSGFICQTHSSEGEDAHTVLSCVNQEALNAGSYLGIYIPYYQEDTVARIKYQKDSVKELKFGEGIILKLRKYDDASHYWHQVAGYQHVENTAQMNPLLRDTIDRDISQKSNGEYHLPVKAIKDLSLKKRKSKISPPEYRCGQRSDKKYLKALKNNVSENIKDTDEAKMSLLVTHTSSAHMTAVRVIWSYGKMIVYLHETIRPDYPVSQEIREFVIQGVLGVKAPDFDKKNVCFFTTAAFECLQKDFSSCSVTALKILMAFDNPKNKLDQFFIDLLNAGNSGSVNYHAFTGKDNSEASLLVAKVDAKIGCIPLAVLPAALLKFYQGKQEQLTEIQKEAIVSHRKGLTLQKYYEKYRYQDDSGKIFNVASMVKTYKYFALWKDMLRNYEHIFQKIFSEQDGEVIATRVNKWLSQTTDESIRIDSDDCKFLKQYKSFLTMEAELNTWCKKKVEIWAENALELNSWLKEIVSSPEADKVKSFLKAWCQYINNNLNQNSEVGRLWFEKDVGFFIKQLDRRIKAIRKNNWSAKYPFHAGEAEYRKRGGDSSNLAFQPIKNIVNYNIVNYTVKTEIEAPRENASGGRVVMTFKRVHDDELIAVNNVCSDDSDIDSDIKVEGCEVSEDEALTGSVSVSGSDVAREDEKLTGISGIFDVATFADFGEAFASFRFLPAVRWDREASSDYLFNQSAEMIAQADAVISEKINLLGKPVTPVYQEHCPEEKRQRTNEGDSPDEAMAASNVERCYCSPGMPQNIQNEKTRDGWSLALTCVDPPFFLEQNSFSGNEDLSFTSALQSFDNRTLEDKESTYSYPVFVDKNSENRQVSKSPKISGVQKRIAITRERNKIAAKKSRLKKKDYFENLKKDVERFADVESMKNASDKEARRNITLEYIKNWLGRYSGNKIFQKKSVDDMAVLIFQKIHSEKSGIPGNNQAIDDDLYLFTRKVIESIRNKIYLESKKLYIEKLKQCQQQKQV